MRDFFREWLRGCIPLLIIGLPVTGVLYLLTIYSDDIDPVPILESVGFTDVKVIDKGSSLQMHGCFFPATAAALVEATSPQKKRVRLTLCGNFSRKAGVTIRYHY